MSLPHYFQVLFTLSISIIMVIKLGGFLIIIFFKIIRTVVEL